MARRTKEDAEATRDSVLMAALDLFSEQGYSRTTFSDIAKRIGMTRGAVYWHFDNKPALLAALIDHTRRRKDELVEREIPDVHSVADIRRSFMAYARVVANDAVTRKFEFFMLYQMEWSEELLTETHKKLNQIRKNPLEEFRACLSIPEVTNRLKPGVDLDQLVLTLASFWIGLCKMYLGRCPKMDFAQRTGSGFDLPVSLTLEQMACNGFDLIMSSVLKEEYRDNE